MQGYPLCFGQYHAGHMSSHNLFLTQVFFQNLWKVVDSVLYAAGSCKMMVPAHN